MYNFNDILAELKSGASVDEIARAFSDALNDAVAKSESSEKEDWYHECVDALAEVWNDAVDAYMEWKHPDLVGNANFHLDHDETDSLIADGIELTLNKASEFEKAMNGLANLLGTDTRPQSKPEPEKVSFEDVMGDFFKKLGIE